MIKTTRISISIEENLLEQFDTHWESQGVPTRSEAFKNLIRSALVQQEWKEGEIIAGVLTIIYDHHKSGILQKIVDVQHDFGDMVICSQHAHLDHHNCMENIIVRGTVTDIQALHRKLRAIKGIKHAAITMTTTGKGLE